MMCVPQQTEGFGRCVQVSFQVLASQLFPVRQASSMGADGPGCSPSVAALGAGANSLHHFPSAVVCLWVIFTPPLHLRETWPCHPIANKTTCDRELLSHLDRDRQLSQAHLQVTVAHSFRELQTLLISSYKIYSKFV